MKLGSDLYEVGFREHCFWSMLSGRMQVAHRKLPVPETKRIDLGSVADWRWRMLSEKVMVMISKGSEV